MKKFFVGILIAFALTLPLSSFAAPVVSSVPSSSKPTHPRIDYSKLTEQQKKDLINSMKTVLTARRAAILKMMENKTIAKEHGDAMIKRIDEKIKHLDRYGLDGMHEHFGHGYGHDHRNTMDGASKVAE